MPRNTLIALPQPIFDEGSVTPDTNINKPGTLLEDIWK